MRKLILLAIFLLSPFAQAGQGTGIGVTVGNPNGATGRSWLREDRSIDYGLGWAITDSKKFQIYSDYLWERPDAFEFNKEKIDVFFGAGLAMRTHAGKSENELSFGPRFPAGVSYSFAEPSLELFGMVALNLGLVPSTEVYVDFNIGARFYLF